MPRLTIELLQEIVQHLPNPDTYKYAFTKVPFLENGALNFTARPSENVRVYELTFHKARYIPSAGVYDWRREFTWELCL